MGWNKKVKLWSNERLDLTDVEKLQTNVYEYLGVTNKNFLAATQYIVSGFVTINNGGTDIKVEPKDGVMLNIDGTVEGMEGTLWIGSGDVSIDADLVEAMTDNATNYVELELYIEDSAPDTKAFWDPTANSGAGDEYNQDVNTCTTIKARLRANTTAFSGSGNYIPLSIVTTSGGTITSIEDSRPLFFRVNSDYTWPDGRTVPASTDFTGADKSITHQKEMFDAICTILKEIKGVEWYENGGITFPGVIHLINSCISPSSINSKLDWTSGVLKITDNNGTPADADVLGNIILHGTSQTLELTRQDGTGSSSTISIADGEVLYVTLPSTGNRVYSGVGSGDTNYKVATSSSLVSDETSYWIAYRKGTQLIVRGMGEFDSGEVHQLGDMIPSALKEYMGSESDTDSDPDYLNSVVTAVAEIHSVTALAASSITTGDCFLLNAANNNPRYYVWANKDGAGADPHIPGYIGIEYAVTTGDTDVQVGDSMATAVNAISDFSAPTTGPTILITNTSKGACDGVIDRNSGFTLSQDTAGVGTPLYNLVEGENLTKGNKRLDEAIFDNENNIDKHFGQLKITALDTPDQSVNISGGDQVKADGTTLIQTANDLMLKFIGCNINFNTGVILDSDGNALGTNFTPTAITASQYLWYSITLTAGTTNLSNTINAYITVLPGTSSGLTPELAPRAQWGTGSKIGQVCVKDNGSGTSGSIENIVQSMVYQLGAGGGGAGGASGSTEIQYVENGNSGDGTIGWTRYANTTAGNRPDDFGGIPSLTSVWDWEVDTSLPMFGDSNFKFNKKTATDIQGDGVYTQFTLENAHVHTKLINELVSRSIGDYTDGNLRMFIVHSFDNFTADFNVVDITPGDILAGDFLPLAGSFQTDATNLYYRLCIHCTSTDTDIWSTDFDEIKVWRKNVVFGTPSTDWEDYIPTMTSTNSDFAIGNGSVTGSWAMVADTLHFQIKAIGGGTTTVGTGEYRWTLPSGLSVDASKLSSGIAKASVTVYDGNSNTKSYAVSFTTGDLVRVTTDDSYSAVGATFPSASWFSSTHSISINGSVPIKGWSSNARMSETTLNRDILFRASGLNNFSNTSDIDMVFPIVDVDLLNKYNSTTGEYEIPETGYYDIKARTVAVATGGYWDSTLHVDGTTVATGPVYDPTYNVGGDLTGDWDNLYLQEGQVLNINIRKYGGSGTISQLSTNVIYNWFTVKKSSKNSQTIYESEKVEYIGSNGSGQIMPNGSFATIAGWTTKENTHGSGLFNSSTGVGTANRSGTLKGSLTVLFSSTWTGTIIGQARNTTTGDVIEVWNTATGYVASVVVPFSIKVREGDNFDFRVQQSSGSGQAIYTSATNNVNFVID